jgi:hypothetical protein
MGHVPAAAVTDPGAAHHSKGVRSGILHLSVTVDCTLSTVSYKGFTITPRTFQIRGSGRWTLDLLIRRHAGLRAFSGPTTYPTEKAAIDGCCEYGRRIIDGEVRDCSVEDLM